MKSISKIWMAAALLLSYATSYAQIKNVKTETVEISGNCGMCKTTIEKAGNLKNAAKVEWNKETKTAILSYDAKKTSKDEILKRIALRGYDNENFRAPDDVYSSLPGCCQYERTALAPVKAKLTATLEPEISEQKEMASAEKESSNQLEVVYASYFKVKDALVASDSKQASTSAKALNTAIAEVKMGDLGVEEHEIWMKVVSSLIKDAKSIAETQNVEKQRSVFNSLSNSVYQLIKVSSSLETVYYQYCPMKKMNWLSKENNVKSPYYGAQMLSCGSTVETIK